MDSLTLDIVCEFRSKAITTETAGLNAVGEPHEIFIPEKKFTYEPGFCIKQSLLKIYTKIDV